MSTLKPFGLSIVVQSLYMLAPDSEALKEVLCCRCKDIGALCRSHLRDWVCQVLHAAMHLSDQQLATVGIVSLHRAQSNLKPLSWVCTYSIPCLLFTYRRLALS